MNTLRRINYDYFLFFATLVLIVIGILFIYSSGIDAEGQLVNNEYLKQILWASLGFFLLVTVSFTKFYFFCEIANVLYGVCLFLLVLTLLVGSTVNGSRSWLGIGSVGIQISEFTKIAVILVLARYLEKSQKTETSSIKKISIAFLIISLPIALILLQPDLGTASVFIPITLVMLFVAGAEIKHLLFVFAVIVFSIIFLVLPEWGLRMYTGSLNFLFIFDRYFVFVFLSLLFALVLAILAFKFFQKIYFYYLSYILAILTISFAASPVLRVVLQDHQLDRLLIFLDPYFDPRGSGWNIIQSITAIGSGGVQGRGFLNGIQSHFQFLPQQSTDFIFSILAEEWGFLGGLALTLLYGVIIFRGITISSKYRGSSGEYIAIGISTMLFFHFFVSVGMSMGLMPITGIPLLFLSYGGSSLWTAMISIGLLISINRT